MLVDLSDTDAIGVDGDHGNSVPTSAIRKNQFLKDGNFYFFEVKAACSASPRHYLRGIAREGGFTRATERPDVAVLTIGAREQQIGLGNRIARFQVGRDDRACCATRRIGIDAR